MPEKNSAMKDFLADIPVANQQPTDDIFEKPLDGSEVQTQPEKDVEVRRAKKALQAEREANIELNAKLQALTERDRFEKETEGKDVNEKLLHLYGDDDKGRQAAKLTQDLLNDTRAQAREEALEAFKQEREQEAKEVASSRQVLDEMLEDIEDEFNVDLTSDTPQAEKDRKGFYATLQKFSPKDKDGQVINYADPIATWETYQTLKQPVQNRAKELSSRSMTPSGASTETKLEQTVSERFLKDNGII